MTETENQLWNYIEESKNMLKKTISKRRKDILLELLETTKKVIEEGNEERINRIVNESFPKVLRGKFKDISENKRNNKINLFEVWKQKEKEFGNLV